MRDGQSESTVNCEQPFCLRALWFIGAGWFLIALLIGETGVLAVMPRMAPQAIAGTITLCLLGSYWMLCGVRTSVDNMSMRSLLGIHLTRFVGIYFLILAGRGELDPRFALPAGWGDIAVAIGAAALMVFRAPRWALLIWNVFGLIDILLVVSAAGALRLSDPNALNGFTSLPLSFLPTMIVPLIIASHVIIFVRLLRRSGSSVISSPAPQMASSGQV